MAERDFRELSQLKALDQKYVCVGLDTDFRVVQELNSKGVHLPTRSISPTAAELVVAYNKMVIEATADIAGAYKPNLAFYRILKEESYWAIRETVALAHEIAPSVPVIIDAKYGDIGNTNECYAQEVFDGYQGDAVTIHGYLGEEANRPFLDRTTKGIFVLDRTSNPKSDEFQAIEVGLTREQLWNALHGPVKETGMDGWDPNIPSYQYMALKVAYHWNKNQNCGLVAGATYPQEAEIIRNIVGYNLPLLIPGVGAQGGDAKDIVPRALQKLSQGCINSSRGIIFAKRLDGETQSDAVRRAAFALDKEIILAQAA